ncbi:MAG: cupin domain-containing protein [Synergistaceae bacterium]|nr:cupin domain-containing protein [Synergistaceae bacterium]
MKITRGNFFELENYQRAPEEFLEVLTSGTGPVRIERIISEGHVSPPDFFYDQDESEFVAVLQGEAAIEFQSKTLKFFKGDWLIIPPHEKHRVIYTSSDPKCIWLTVFFN